MEGIHIGIVTLTALIVLVPVVFVWYVTCGGIYLVIKRARQKNKEGITCSVDSDCPVGYVCINGNCVPAQ